MKKVLAALAVTFAVVMPLEAGIEYEARTWQEGQQKNKQAEMTVRGKIDGDKATVTREFDAGLETMRQGMRLDGAMTRKARVKRISARRFRIVLKEGKNRQIRRMVRKVGNAVTRLQRRRFAGIKLGNLAPGRWRHLTPEEKKRLMNSL